LNLDMGRRFGVGPLHRAEDMTKIQYIGHKPHKTDNVAGTATTWAGHGDVQDVPDDSAAKLLRFPGVWQVAEEAEEAEASKSAPAAGDAAATELDKAALLARAAELGIKADGRMGVAKLSALIEEAEASKAG
jgi:hypothetical protein